VLLKVASRMRFSAYAFASGRTETKSLRGCCSTSAEQRNTSTRFRELYCRF
jgi:hypothetical protein